MSMYTDTPGKDNSFMWYKSDVDYFANSIFHDELKTKDEHTKLHRFLFEVFY